ncbi:hypothetical protein K4K54_003831 [Colletotrichum sp. SAR 10_86]|nr:hypothetical protein K4K54_003831 [Colletotrichum sp. SAR 10_86]KAJ4995454.1 hypothetical protein K4K48_010318 [Colletotrichum sp. SAR 10_66]
MPNCDGQSGERADEEQSRDTPPSDTPPRDSTSDESPRDTPPRDPTSDESPRVDHPTDESASNEPAEDQENSDSRQWPIVAIVDHRTDPEDATRLQFRINWAETDGSSWDPTWEPEANIQLDAPHLWREYASRHNCRDALGKNKHKYHMLCMVRHEVIRRRRGEATVVFDVQWEGSATLSKLSEKAAKGRNAELVADYWERVGGREKALNK